MKNSKLVYSTETGRVSETDTSPTIPAHDGFIYMERQVKGRKGKGVTVISGFGIAEKELKKLAKILKQHCSTGGAVKGFTIEIQGDQRAIIGQYLEEKGYKIKRVGG